MGCVFPLSSLCCPMWNSGEMTIGKTHPTLLIMKILTVAIGYWILNFLVLVKLGSVGLGRRTATFHIWHFRIPLLFGTNFSLGPITAGWTLPSISWFNVDSRRTVVRPEPDDRFTVERFTRFEDRRPEMWDSLKIIVWAYPLLGFILTLAAWLSTLDSKIELPRYHGS